MDDPEDDGGLVEYLARQAARARLEYLIPDAVLYGITEFETYLTNWAAFREWEAAHPTIPKEALACAS